MSNTLTLYVRVRGPDLSEGPPWAKIILDAKLWATIKSMRALIKAKDWRSIATYNEPETWGSKRENESYRMEDAHLEVFDSFFCYRATPKYGDMTHETDGINFRDIEGLHEDGEGFYLDTLRVAENVYVLGPTVEESENLLEMLREQGEVT